MSIFKAYDIRGVYPNELNEEIAERLGKAVGTFLKEKTVCVGYDTRNSSPSIFDFFSKGLASTGCNVFAIGLIPNPVNYFYAWKKGIYGCYVTASHNSSEWNGMKFSNPDGTSFIDEIKEIERIYNSQNFIKGEGKIENVNNAMEIYEEFLKANIKNQKGKVVIECFGGAGVKAIEILRNLGLDVISLHDKPDGNFYGVERPEPKGENLQFLINEIKAKSVDFGVAFDGDGDRAVFVDEKGRELNGSMMIPIFVRDILKSRKGTIIVTADCASEIKKIVEDHGGRLIWWRVGHGFIEKKSQEEKTLFSGEHSSHFYFSYLYPFSDGILSVLYLAKILNKSEKKLSNLVDEIKMHPVDKLYINVGNDENKNRILGEIKKKFPESLDIMDGVKIELNDIEWVLLRASQTNPEINLCVEAINEKRLRELIEEYSNLIKDLREKLG
jgi:phosphomannomutase/phosphoglucomutase